MKRERAPSKKRKSTDTFCPNDIKDLIVFGREKERKRGGEEKLKRERDFFPKEEGREEEEGEGKRKGKRITKKKSFFYLRSPSSDSPRG